jgi:hypothetical protein
MRKITLGISSVVFAAVSALLSNAASAQQVSIAGFVSGGSGCPGDTVRGLLTSSLPGTLPDTLTLLFDAYIAEQGPGIASIERRKNCNITIDLAVPQGFSFSLVEAEYRGFADLPTGVKGVQSTTYSFPFSNSATFQTVLNGPLTANYKRNDELGAAVFSPCKQSVPLTLATQAFLSGDRTKSALITLDQTTTRVTHIYSFQWRRC